MKFCEIFGKFFRLWSYEKTKNNLTIKLFMYARAQAMIAGDYEGGVVVARKTY